MRKRIAILRGITVLSAVVFFNGCAAHWSPSHNGKVRFNGQGKFAVLEPSGWMIFTKGAVTVYSRHGIDFDVIAVEGRNLSRIPLDTAPQPRPGMLPPEIGEVVLLDCQASPRVYDIELLGESQVTLAGNQAIKIEIRYKVTGDLVKRAISHAFVYGTRFYEVSFSALENHYFNAGLDEYYRVLESFVIR